MRQPDITFEINGKEYLNESHDFNPHMPDVLVSEDLPETLPDEIKCFLKNSFGAVRMYRMLGLTKTGARSFRFNSVQAGF
jgi:hypothetical protein